MDIYKVYTVEGARIDDGALVVEHAIPGSHQVIAAVTVGEAGKGRGIAALPVEGVAPGNRIAHAGLGLSQHGRPVLVAGSSLSSRDRAVVVLRTPAGVGGSAHTGKRQQDGSYAPLPARVLARGVVAVGADGRRGAGYQLIAVIDRGAVIRAVSGGIEWLYVFADDGIRCVGRHHGLVHT